MTEAAGDIRAFPAADPVLVAEWQARAARMLIQLAGYGTAKGLQPVAWRIPPMAPHLVIRCQGLWDSPEADVRAWLDALTELAGPPMVTVAQHDAADSRGDDRIYAIWNDYQRVRITLTLDTWRLRAGLPVPPVG